MTDFTYPNPNPRYEMYIAGWAQGWAARDPEIAQLKADRDRFYRCAFDTPENVTRRLDRAAETYWEQIIAGKIALHDVDPESARIAREEWIGGEAA